MMASSNQGCPAKPYSQKPATDHMHKVIEASGISKIFGTTKALNDISFSVNESEVFGFIGPDGSGKTTLFRIITTLLLPLSLIHI